MIRVALKMLMGDRSRYVTLLIGLTAVAFLFVQQGSVFSGIIVRIAKPVDEVGAPIWVCDPKLQSIDDSKPLLDTDLQRVRSVPGVKWAVPLFLRTVQLRLKDGSFQNVRLFGLDDDSLIGRPLRMVAGTTSGLFSPDAVIVGQAESERIGNPQIGDTFELNDRRAVVVGIAKVSRDYASNPYVYTTYDRALAYTPAQRKQLNFVLAAPKEGFSPETIATQIRAATGLGAYSLDGMRRLTIGYYLRNTAIPVNFGLGLLMTFLVGISVAGQALYAFALQNERFTAGLKAMGAENPTLVWMSVTQGLTVGMVSLGIGSGAASFFGYATGGGTGKLAFYTPWQLLAVTFVVVVMICILSSLFSVRRVLRLEPAAVFRG
jgi:putative ABC transport system permease protein